MKSEKSWGILGQGLAILTLTAALAGCGGSSDAGSSDSGATTSGASVAGDSPSVSGTPQTTVAVNNRYNFTPTVANPAGKVLTFGIQNKPSWATFGETSGQLSGTPATPDTGHYSNIVITANDGTTTTGLPAFSIEVTPTGSAAASSSSSGSGSSSGSAAASSPSSSSSGGTKVATASTSGTMIPSATQIVDSGLNVWTLASGLIYENGTAAGYSSNVGLLLYYNGTVYQENKTCLWWSWSGSAWVATSNPAPSVAPACSATVASAGATSSSSSGGSSSGASSATGSAATLLSYLSSLQGQTRHIMAGQHTSYWDPNVLDVEQNAASQTGKAVAILGTTTGMVGSTENGVSVSNAWLAQGGIVQVSWWPQDPITGSWNENSPMSAANFASLTQAGSAGYIAWHKLLDAQIAQLKQINGPVIYRPMLEMNGNWSWWQNQTPATYALLWQQMHDYFAANGVTNVLWFFCPNDGKGNYLGYYAGDQYVDIVGMDVYSNTPAHDMTVDGGYAQLTGTGKPFMIGEAGISNGNNSSITQDMGSNESYTQSIEQGTPLVVGIVFFCQNWAISVQNGAAALMNDPAVIAMNDLPAGVVAP
jgi:Glycosyl hydrolase family 26